MKTRNRFSWQQAVLTAKSDDGDPLFGNATRIVACGLALIHMNDNNGRWGTRCWPKQSTLSSSLGMHRTTVHKAVQDLREAGYLVTLRTPRHLVYEGCWGDAPDPTDEDACRSFFGQDDDVAQGPQRDVVEGPHQTSDVAEGPQRDVAEGPQRDVAEGPHAKNLIRRTSEKEPQKKTPEQRGDFDVWLNELFDKFGLSLGASSTSLSMKLLGLCDDRAEAEAYALDGLGNMAIDDAPLSKIVRALGKREHLDRYRRSLAAGREAPRTTRQPRMRRQAVPTADEYDDASPDFLTVEQFKGGVHVH